ncbi:hypothetical protein TNCV_4397221 [Trichonephila clavipes]|nr:hypothetical protein TNCV_4397221 [Trichonephila clavipes]
MRGLAVRQLSVTDNYCNRVMGSIRGSSANPLGNSKAIGDGPRHSEPLSSVMTIPELTQPIRTTTPSQRDGFETGQIERELTPLRGWSSVTRGLEPANTTTPATSS